MQFKSSIILISSDDFIIGLIKGYSIANAIDFNLLSTDKVLQQTDFIDNTNTIIIDTRKLNASIHKPNLKTLCQINDELKIPVCAIIKDKNDNIIHTELWIDRFFYDPIIDSLHQYFQSNFYQQSPGNRERRNKDRREVWDRRASAPPPTTTYSTATNFPDQIYPQPDYTKNHFKLGPFVINNNCKSVTLLDKDLGLTCKEFKLFSLLATDVGHVFSAEEIIKHLWPGTYRADKSDLYQYMHLLRRKIENDPDNPIWILTIKGVGYRLNIFENNHLLPPLLSIAKNKDPDKLFNTK